jgi:hypothetical protein
MIKFWTVSLLLIAKVIGQCTATPFVGLAGSSGRIDASSTSARFNLPADIVKDSTGNFYVSDLNNHVIRKVTPAGEVTTFAGSGTAGATDATGIGASFNQPFGMTRDSAGDFYVSEQDGRRVRKITAAGEVTTIAGSGDSGTSDGDGSVARFQNPLLLALLEHHHQLEAQIAVHSLFLLAK